MSTSTVTPPVGAGAGAGSAAGTPGAGAGNGTPNIGTGTPGGAGAGAGDGGAAAKPGKVSFDLGDGSGPVEIDLEGSPEGSGEGAGAAGTEFKFADLDGIKDSHPDLYKSLKAELSKATRYSKFGLKSPEDYKTQAERIERLSGGKGLDGLESTMSNMARELQNFRSGDVTDWAKESPEEFGFAASKIVDQWGQADPKGYVGHVAKAAMYALLQKDSYGQSAIDAFNTAYQLASKGPLTAEQAQNVQRLLDRVAHTLDNINQNSQYQPDQTAVKERQIAQREASVWNQKVDFETTSLIRPALSRALNAAAQTYGLEIDPDDRASFLSDMETKWYEAAKGDKKFLRALDAAGKAKDLDEIKSLVKSNRQAFAAEALKEIYRSRLSKLKGNLRKEAGAKGEAGSAGAASSGTIPWTGAIDQRTGSPVADMDFARMKAEDPDMLWNHQFYVKGKKEKFTY